MGHYIFPKKLPLLGGESGPHVTYGIYRAHASQNCPISLVFRHPAGRGPSHGHGQHAQKMVEIARVERTGQWNDFELIRTVKWKLDIP